MQYDLKSVIRRDLDANPYLDRRAKSLLVLYRLCHALHASSADASFLARKARVLALRLLLIPYGMLCHSYGCFLPYTTVLGQRVVFRHAFYGIFISQGAVIGDDVVLYHQVTVGSNHDTSSNPGSPVIGDRVLIGAGAKVIGNIVIGDDVRIGSNASVVKDVEPMSTVIAASVRVIRREG